MLRKILETREFTTKSQTYDTGWAIPLFGDVNFSDALLGALFGIIDVIAIDQPDHIRVLFNSPGFAQIGQLGFRRLTLLYRPAELRERHHRDIQLFGQGFEGTSNARNFLLATPSTATYLHQLQVVHDDEGEVSQFYLQAPRFRTDIQCGLRWRIMIIGAPESAAAALVNRGQSSRLRKPVRSFEGSTRAWEQRNRTTSCSWTFRG